MALNATGEKKFKLWPCQRERSQTCAWSCTHTTCCCVTAHSQLSALQIQHARPLSEVSLPSADRIITLAFPDPVTDTHTLIAHVAGGPCKANLESCRFQWFSLDLTHCCFFPFLEFLWLRNADVLSSTLASGNRLILPGFLDSFMFAWFASSMDQGCSDLDAAQLMPGNFFGWIGVRGASSAQKIGAFLLHVLRANLCTLIGSSTYVFLWLFPSSTFPARSWVPKRASTMS